MIPRPDDKTCGNDIITIEPDSKPQVMWINITMLAHKILKNGHAGAFGCDQTDSANNIKSRIGIVHHARAIFSQLKHGRVSMMLSLVVLLLQSMCILATLCTFLSYMALLACVSVLCLCYMAK